MGKFRNVILCDDIRDEMGNKKSLMGVYSGDILVQNFPAAVQIAFYVDYVPAEDEAGEIPVQFRITQDGAEIAKAQIQAKIDKGPTVTLIIPKGVASFDKASTLGLYGKVYDEPEVMLLTKRILLISGSSPTAT